MSYKINGIRTVDDFVYTDVTFTFGDKEVSVSIPHFQPRSKEDIIAGIEGRMASEEQKLIACDLCVKVAAELKG